jgi:hypothetical protein
VDYQVRLPAVLEEPLVRERVATDDDLEPCVLDDVTDRAVAGVYRWNRADRDAVLLVDDLALILKLRVT